MARNIESPPDAPNLIMIGDDSQFPLQAGWLVFYGPENQRVPVECIGKLCVLQIKDGPTLLKILKRSPRKGLFRLENWNTSPLDGVKLDWAARVRQIQCDSGQ
jgi:hypothetical protein